MKKSVIKKYKETKRGALLVYFILRILVIICCIFEFISGNIMNGLLCILSLVLFTFPSILQNKTKIELPSFLEAMIYLFIYASEILGEINNFYGLIPIWDTILHIINGFLCAGIGFALVDLLNKNSIEFNLSPLYMAIVSFCFSMTIGICWEFFEYSFDKYLYTDMQKDRVVNTISSIKLNENGENHSVIVNNIEKTIIQTDDGEYVIDGYLDIGLNDTMKDLFVNMLGATLFNVIGYIFVIRKNDNKFLNKFVPRLKEENNE